MKTADLAGPVLKSVSRSFYLSIRLLPARIRAPIGLGYLLARASDTIADTAQAPESVRLRHLAAFGEMIRAGGRAGLPDLQREIVPPHPGEQRLIQGLDRCLEWLASMPDGDRREIASVMEKIIRGQTLDLQRFPAGEGIRALQTAEELNEYTYLVAGSVGEFWTRICCAHVPDYSTESEATLLEWGRRYGQGLQLVNILRDIPTDRRAGRCYLPEVEILETDSTLTRPSLYVFDEWHERACECMEDGQRYIASLRPARLRAACYLPWTLGIETLRLISTDRPVEKDVAVKVPRSVVRAALRRAVFVAFSNRWLRI